MSGIPVFRKQAGSVLLSLLASVAYLFLGLVLVTLAYFGFCEARKAYWDHKVRLMCEKDGGLTIYEKVTISRSRNKNLFSEVNGILNIPYDLIAKPDHAYYAKSEPEKVIRESAPKVWQDEYLHIRKADNKVIARQRYYARRGGDFPIGIAHDSSFSCPTSEQAQKSLQTLFVTEE